MTRSCAYENAQPGLRVTGLSNRAVDSGDGNDRQGREYLLDGFVQRGAGLRLAAAAAIRAARARLQFGELVDAFGSGSADVAVSDGVAHADIHGHIWERKCE